MRVQISSGQGPAECELAVAMLYEELRREAGDVRLVGCTPERSLAACHLWSFETDRDLRSWRAVCSGFAKSLPSRPQEEELVCGCQHTGPGPKDIRGKNGAF